MPLFSVLTHAYNYFAPSYETAEPTPRRRRRPRRVWNPSDELVVTDKCSESLIGSCAGHKRRRYEDLSQCKTVEDAMNLYIQPTRTGSHRKYSASDLAYDTKIGYVRVIQTTSTHPVAATHPPKDPVACVSSFYE